MIKCIAENVTFPLGLFDKRLVKRGSEYPQEQQLSQKSQVTSFLLKKGLLKSKIDVALPYTALPPARNVRTARCSLKKKINKGGGRRGKERRGKRRSGERNGKGKERKGWEEKEREKDRDHQGFLSLHLTSPKSLQVL